MSQLQPNTNASGFPPPRPRPPGVYVGCKALIDEDYKRWPDGGPSYYDGNLHQLLIGTTGTGKGMRLLAPNLLTMFGKSLMVIDPKGQLAMMTALYRKHRGDDVHILDPFGVIPEFCQQFPQHYSRLIDAGLAESACFNPLAQLVGTNQKLVFDEIRSISQAMLPTVSGENEFWPKAGRALLCGLMMWELEEKGQQANLLNVYRTLTMPERVRTIINRRTGETVTSRSGLSTFIQDIQALEVGGPHLKKVQSLLGRFGEGKSNETLDSIRITAEMECEWINSDPIADNLSAGIGIDLSRLKYGERPMTVYAVLPSKYLKAHQIWLRLVVDATIRAGLVSGRQRDVLMILDEFKALGFMEIIQDTWGVSRDYGLAYWAALQDLGQLTKTYPQHGTMLSSADILHFLRTDDLDTMNYVSQRSGSRTVIKPGVNQQRNRSDTGHINTGEGDNRELIEMPFIRPNEMRGLSLDQAVMFIGGDKEFAVMSLPHLSTDMLYTRQLALENPYWLTR